MKINPSKSKAVHFTTARVTDPLDYSLANTLIPEASSYNYLEIILRCDLSWADQVNYPVKKAWKALYFTMRIFKKGNSNIKRSVFLPLVRPILEYGAAYWDPYREGQIIAFGCKRKWPNLHIIRTVQTGKLWRRVESYHIYVLSPKRILENGRGRL